MSIAEEQASPNVAEFPCGDTELARLIRERDWSDTSVGSIDNWPQSLRVIVAMITQSPLPMAVLWGADGTMIYNDAYSAVCGLRHPSLLGRPVRDGWPEVSELTDRIMQVRLDGGAITYRDQEMELLRSGKPERVWANLDYSPLLDETGASAGVLAIVTETTERVLAERQLRAEHDRLQAMFDQAPGFVAMLEGPQHVFVLINQAYRRLLGSRDLIGRAVREAVPEAEGQGFVGLLDTAYQSGKPVLGEAAKLVLPDDDGRMRDHYVDFVYQPVVDQTGSVTGIFVQGSDVSEHMLSEGKLRDSQQEYRRLNDALITANDILASVMPRAPGLSDDESGHP